MKDPNLPTDPRSGARHESVPTGSTPPAPPTPPATPGPTQPIPAAPPVQPSQPFGEASFLDDTTTVQDRIDTKPSMIGRAGLVVAALAVAGGGAFAVTRALSEPAGPESPEAAIDQMFAAIDNDDLVGMAEVMLPSERESLFEPMDDLLDELARLEIVESGFDLDEAADTGLDFTVSGLSYTTTPVGAGVVNAEITGGVVSVRGEVSDLPFGDRTGRELGDEVMAESFDDEVVDFADGNEVRLTLVEEDGSWYVSLWYTVAEGIRGETDQPAPAFGQGVVPVGSSTPEGAVRSIMERAVDLDAEGVIATLDPAEFRALHDYAPLFLDDVEQAAADVRRQAAEEGISWSLDRLDLESSVTRGRTVVTIDGFAFSASDGTQSFSVDFDGDCFTAITGNEIDQICVEELTEEMGAPSTYLDAVQDYTGGVTVVERDGEWYVSGMPTILGAYADFLAALEPEDIEAFTDFFDQAMQGGFGMMDPFGLEPYGFDPYGQTEEGWFEYEELEGFEEFEYPEGEQLEKLDDYVEPTLDPSAVDVFLPDLELSAAEPDFSYFASVTDQRAVWYAYGTSNVDFASIEIVAFDVPAADLVAAMDQVDSYVLIEVEGLPEGAVAYEWPEIDRVVVIDNYLVSAYYGFEGNQELLLAQVLHIAGS